MTLIGLCLPVPFHQRLILPLHVANNHKNQDFREGGDYLRPMLLHLLLLPFHSYSLHVVHPAKLHTTHPRNAQVQGVQSSAQCAQ